jgi:hypothetical protein
VKLKILHSFMLLCSLALLPARGQTNSAIAIPHLETHGAATQLIVDGKPFLVLGAEVHNSSTSSLPYTEPVLAGYSSQHVNTALAAVTWEMLEPEEGKLDYSLVDGLIQEARRDKLHLILLWFGSWKNGVSTYPPLWVKTDLKRFPRALDKEGASIDVLSPFSDANRDADARAFAALMRHIRIVDSDAHTVLMVQVENEVGIFPEARDYSAAANEAFERPVPKELLDYLRQHKDTLIPEFRKIWDAAGSKTSGNWREVFGAGDATDEIFMAWSFARYIERVAAAGKAEYPLPMFVNAALPESLAPEALKPGNFGFGGPLPRVLDIWRAGAPHLDIFSPDLYIDFDRRCALYHRNGNPLFIPEMQRDTRAASSFFYALGQYDAIGVSPFGLESTPATAVEVGRSYEVLAQMAPVILANQGKGVIGGVVLDKDHPGQKLRVGDYTLDIEVARHWSFATPEFPAGIFIQTGPDEFIVAGRGIIVTFTPNTPGAPIVGLAQVDDGTFVNGSWVAGRRLNGDEILSGKGLRLRGDYYMIQRVKLYRYR